MKTNCIQQTFLFKASPTEVYEMIVDSKKYRSLSGELIARISEEEYRTKLKTRERLLLAPTSGS
jgi:hypothetical protein